MRRKPFIALVMAISLSVGPPAAYAKEAPALPAQAQQAFDNKIVKRINVANIYNDIAHLSSEPRVAGTEAEWKAVQYIESKFSSFGYDTEIQPFKFENYQEPTISLTVAGAALSPDSFTYTPNGEATGEVVYVGLAKEVDLKGVDLTGKIALVKRGEISFADKVLNAATSRSVSSSHL